MVRMQGIRLVILLFLSFAWTGSGVCIYDAASSEKCSDPSLQPVINTLAETYGPGSQCVDVGTWATTEGGILIASDPAIESGCYQYSCSRNTGVTIIVLGNSFTCSRKGEVLDVDITESGVRYQGTLICPSCAEICRDELFNCPEILSVDLNFERSVYRVNETVGSQNLALYVCLTANGVDRPFAATLTPVSGTATAGEDFADMSEEIEFEVGREVRSCGCVGIIDDLTADSDEVEMFQLTAVVTDELVETSGQTTAIVEVADSTYDESLLTAVPQRILDSRLYFMNDSPRVYGNSVSADFVVGRSFTSVKCQLNTRNRKPRDCSGGSVVYRNLNRRRRRAFQLRVTGTLPNGSTVELVRNVHIDTIAACRVHFINNGTTVKGNTITFEWEGTGPAARRGIDVPFHCRIDGITSFTPCTSPYTVTPFGLLKSRTYTFTVLYDRRRRVCRRQRISRLKFQITGDE